MHTWLITYTLKISQKVQSEWVGNCSAALHIERALNGPLRSKEGNHLVCGRGTFVNPSDIHEYLIHFLNLPNDSVARIAWKTLFRSTVSLPVILRLGGRMCGLYFALWSGKFIFASLCPLSKIN